MGTLQNIRRMSPYVFGVFAVLLVAFFTIGDPTIIEGVRGTTGDPKTQVIATINGTPIYYLDYEQRIKDEEENAKREAEKSGQPFDANATRQRVWQALVDEALLEQQIKNFGIMITDNQIKEQLIDNPPDFLKQMFSDSAGNFMRSTYLELITKPEQYVNYMGGDPSQIPIEEKELAVSNFRRDLFRIEKYVAQVLKQEELTAAVATSSAIISSEYARMKFVQENSTADLRFFPLLIRDLPQQAMEAKKEEIEEYYNKNKKLYKQKPQRKIKYIAMPLVPSAEDSARSERRAKNVADELMTAGTDAAKDSIFDIKLSEYNGMTHNYLMVEEIDPQVYGILSILKPGQVAGPINRPDGIYFLRVDDIRSGQNEVVKASHILINFDNNKDSARAEANRILRDARSNPNNFAILAMQYSKDPGSGQRGGDLGFFGKGRMVPEFEQAAFAAKVGDIVGPVESQFGFHIIKVDDKRSEELKYSELRLSPTLSTATKSQLFRDAHSIKSQVQEGLSFDTLAARLGLEVKESQYFDANIPVLGSKRLSDIAFSEKVGFVIEPVEMERYGVVLAQVADAKEIGFKVLDDVREEISRKIIKKKQLDMLGEQIAPYFDRIKALGGLKAAAEQDTELAGKIQSLNSYNNTPTVPGFGQDAAFAATVFNSELNKLIGPFRGENGYYIISVENITKPTDEEIAAAMKEYKVELQVATKGSIFFQWFQKVKENAKIVDNRSKFYPEY
jgi:parvulin-like peptidyl-prolyl isomerase